MTKLPVGVVLEERVTDRVWFARWHGRHVVVKRGSIEALTREATALRLLQAGCTELLWESTDGDAGGALIVLERVLLGDDLYPLIESDDHAATRAIAAILVRLHGAGSVAPDVAASLPALAGIAGTLEVDDARLPRSLRDRARGLLRDLCGDDGNGRALHGDLHHGNVLRSGPWPPDGTSGWVAIDPHGWYGDPVFDTAPALANPRSIPRADLVARTRRRIDILAEVSGWDRSRIATWAYVGAVLAEARLLRDHGLVHGAPLELAAGLAETERF